MQDRDGGTASAARSGRGVGGIQAPGVDGRPARSRCRTRARISARPRCAPARRSDPEDFVTVLSGLDPDPNWIVRAALASVLGTLTPEIALPRLTTMLERQRSAGDSVGAGGAGQASTTRTSSTILIERLKADDPAVRVAAAAGLGELKPPAGAQALAAAYELGPARPMYTARAAALGALRQYGAAAARAGLETRAGGQGLGGPRPRGGAAEGARSRRATSSAADSAGADADSGRRLSDAASGHAAGVDAGLPRHRPRHDSDRARGARRAADRGELRARSRAADSSTA